MIKTMLILTFLVGWYFTCFLIFIKVDTSMKDSPQLRARLGTILWHSSDRGGEPHLYCYYPKSSANFNRKGGEHILSRVQNLEDCKSWFGAVIFNEAPWVSEREKIWWSKDQKIQDNLISKLLTS